MQEYWVNVYKYPKLSDLVYSHKIERRISAELQGKREYTDNRKCVYRIHVKMRPVVPDYMVANNPSWCYVKPTPMREFNPGPVNPTHCYVNRPLVEDIFQKLNWMD